MVQGGDPQQPSPRPLSNSARQEEQAPSEDRRPPGHPLHPSEPRQGHTCNAHVQTHSWWAWPGRVWSSRGQAWGGVAGTETKGSQRTCVREHTCMWVFTWPGQWLRGWMGDRPSVHIPGKGSSPLLSWETEPRAGQTALALSSIGEECPVSASVSEEQRTGQRE